MIKIADLPKIAFNATAGVFILGLASMAGHSAWADRTSDLSGGVWAAFAFLAVCCMAAAAHTIPKTWMRNEAAWFWFFLFLVVASFPWAFYFDFMAVSSIFDKAAVVQNTAYKKRSSRERTEADLAEELRRLNDTLGVVATIVDGGSQRPVRTLKAIEADGRFLASGRCANIDPRNAGQRTVCQEHSTAADRAEKEGRKIKILDELRAQREKLETTEAVVSDEVAGTRRLQMILGWSKTATNVYLPLGLTLLAELLAVLVPMAAGYVTHAHSSTPAPRRDGEAGPPVQVHVHAAPAAQAPAPLALSAPGRVYDPTKQALLVGKFWSETIPSLPKERQAAGTFLPKFDTLCAAENVETPTREAFCTLSAAHLPNAELLAGQLWFTPV